MLETLKDISTSFERICNQLKGITCSFQSMITTIEAPVMPQDHNYSSDHIMSQGYSDEQLALQGYNSKMLMSQDYSEPLVA